MSMYKRPSQRVKIDHDGRCHAPAREGTFLYNLLNPPPTKFPVKVKQPVYHQDYYLKLLKASDERMGLKYVDPGLPIVIPVVYPDPPQEPDLPYSDHIRVTLKILKNGIVRVKVYPSIAILHERYWSKCIVPPLKPVIQAFKAYGFSDEFIKNIEKSQKKADLFKQKVGKIIEKIFDKEPVKKIKKKKKVEEVIEEDDVPLVPDEPEEEETLDVEPDEEEEVEEEEYISDGGE
jgi:hypothetical protein